ncbi:MAG: GNAT family N-acetyltransferase [bacterium]|nr:GNAT family N-acetyltransferase [bacterium]
MKIERLGQAEYEGILHDLADYWGDDRTRELHHPMFVHEFRDTAFMIQMGGLTAAYLLGFVARDSRYGYVHLAAVRGSHRQRGMARALYEHFFEYCRARDVRLVKAITSPRNRFSILFHKRMGFRLFGETIEHGVPVIKNYSGRGADRVVMYRRLSD